MTLNEKVKIIAGDSHIWKHGSPFWANQIELRPYTLHPLRMLNLIKYLDASTPKTIAETMWREFAG
jgi:hypothetical protein